MCGIANFDTLLLVPHLPIEIDGHVIAIRNKARQDRDAPARPSIWRAHGSSTFFVLLALIADVARELADR
jgi:hypothetical protein